MTVDTRAPALSVTRLIIAMAAITGLIFFALSSPVAAESDGKVFVCKWVSTPGADERLQTGQNPISVSVNAIPSWVDGMDINDLVGEEFADKHGRSVVIAVDTGQVPEPDIFDCLPPETPEVSLLSVCEPESETPRIKLVALVLLGLHVFLDDDSGSGFVEVVLDGFGEAEVEPGTYDWEIRDGDDEVLNSGTLTVEACPAGVEPTPTPTPGQPTPTPTPEGGAQGATGTPGASLANTAMSLGGLGGPLATVVFGLILLGSLGALAYANVTAVRRRG